MAKKLHWTQTPEGRKRMSAIVPEQHAARTHKVRGPYNKKKNPEALVAQAVLAAARTVETRRDRAIEDDVRNHVAYLYGRTDAFIEHYSATTNVPCPVLAANLGKLLLGKAREAVRD